MDPRNGAIRSLVGGFDFQKNKFNHVTQAWRQPGSSFKPFIYSAALEKGFTPATVVNDAPLFFDSGVTGGQPWEPKNYDGVFEGPMPLRRALARSKNMVSIRVLDAIGPRLQAAELDGRRIPFARIPPALVILGLAHRGDGRKFGGQPRIHTVQIERHTGQDQPPDHRRRGPAAP